MNYLIRKADKDDVTALASLERECFCEPWSEKSLSDFMDGDVIVLAALDGERIIGYVGAYLSFGDADITNVAVTSDHRRRGIGAQLIRALEEDARVERILLEVRESNSPARALYEQLGFKIDGRRKGFYSNPREDAILMSLECSK